MIARVFFRGDSLAALKHFKAIAAMSENRVIGCGNKIPWHLPEDFKWFKKTTIGHVVVFGRRTFEGLPKAIPNRRKLVLTRHPKKLIRDNPAIFGRYKEWLGGSEPKEAYQFRFVKLDEDANDDIRIFNSLEKIRPEEFACDVYICGGAEVYAQALPLCSDLYLTIVKRTVEGDAYFPAFEEMFSEGVQIEEYPDFKILHYRNRLLPA